MACLVQIRSKRSGYTDSYIIYDMQHMICLVNEIPKALKPPESAPMATSCSFINAKQIKTTNKS